jgi:hypothetical protein
MALPASLQRLVGGIDLDIYQGLDMSPAEGKIRVKVLLKANQQTGGFQQANGRSILGNIMSLVPAIYYVQVDTESSEFKALGVDEESWSFLDSSITANLPKELVCVTADEARENAGITVNLTDNEGELADDLLTIALHKGVRALIAEFEVDALCTYQLLKTPTLILTGHELVRVYDAPRVSVVGQNALATGQSEAIRTRMEGIQDRTKFGATNSNLAMYAAGRMGMGVAVPVTSSNVRKSAATGAGAGAFVRPTTAVQPITARPNPVPATVPSAGVTLPAAPALPTP